MLPLKILQWNMAAAPHARKPKPHPNPAKSAAALTALLHDHAPTIVALQETDPTILAQVKLTAYDLQRGPMGLTTLVLRQAYRPVRNSDIRQRVQVVELDAATPGGASLLVFNLHLPVLYKTELERREFARVFLLPEMTRLRVLGQARLEIIAGDFNLPPYDEIIVGESGLFANRDLAHTSKRRSTVGRPIYNTSWAIFGGACGALGTYHGPSLAHGPWQIPDQLLLDPRLAENRRVRVQVLTKTSGQDLHTPLPFGYPNKTTASDHFPVLVTLDPLPATGATGGVQT